MEIEGVVATVRRLQGFFGKKLTSEAFEFYVQEFRLLPDNIFRAAVTEAQRTEKSFPTVHVLKNYVVETRREMERADNARSKVKSFEDLARAQPSDPECIKESRRIFACIALPCGHPDHLCGEKLVAAMLTMEKAFPGRGWGENGNGLKSDLEKDAKARNAVEERQRQVVVERPPPVVRQFADVHEKSAFYKKLFAERQVTSARNDAEVK